MAPLQGLLFFWAARTHICCISKAVTPAITDRLVHSGAPMFVSLILAKVQAYFRYRETVRELSLLSDRELTDLSIARFQIDSVARQSAAA